MHMGTGHCMGLWWCWGKCHSCKQWSLPLGLYAFAGMPKDLQGFWRSRCSPLTSAAPTEAGRKLCTCIPDPCNGAAGATLRSLGSGTEACMATRATGCQHWPGSALPTLGTGGKCQKHVREGAAGAGHGQAGSHLAHKAGLVHEEPAQTRGLLGDGVGVEASQAVPQRQVLGLVVFGRCLGGDMMWGGKKIGEGPGVPGGPALALQGNGQRGCSNNCPPLQHPQDPEGALFIVHRTAGTQNPAHSPRQTQI